MSFRRKRNHRTRRFLRRLPGNLWCLRRHRYVSACKENCYRLLFNPSAVVDHLGAPQAIGKRFDRRYAFYAQRNHVVKLNSQFWRLVTALMVRYALTRAYGTVKWIVRQLWFFVKRNV